MGFFKKIQTPADLKAKVDRMKALQDKRNLIGGAGGVRKIPSMKEGGMVEKTMPHHLHKGEMVVPAHLVKHFHRLMSKNP